MKNAVKRIAVGEALHSKIANNFRLSFWQLSYRCYMQKIMVQTRNQKFFSAAVYKN